MATAVAEREPIVADEAERGALDAIEHALRPAADRRAAIVGADGARTELPESPVEASPSSRSAWS